MTPVLHCGDCREVLPTLPENSIDAVVTDPPYALVSSVKRFGKTSESDDTKTSERTRNRADGYARLRGAKWDTGEVAFDPAFWAEVLRVLKPGGYVVACAGARTYHRLACAIEDAGFLTHPMLGWITVQGFPKAHKVNDPAWEGWYYGGQSLKPALEPIYMGQKPFSEKTGTTNVLKWGTGAINVDGCRIPSSQADQELMHRCLDFNKSYSNGEPSVSLCGGVDGSLHRRDRSEFDRSKGRWPANVCHDGSDEVLAAFPDSKSCDSPSSARCEGTIFGGSRTQGAIYPGEDGSAARFFASFPNGRDGEASAERRYTDEGSTNFAALPGMRRDAVPPARIFCCSKADADDRLGSRHPTVKPVDLMQWLVRLITPPGGTVLDPFTGTGTTGEACLREGFHAVLIEREAEYQDDIRRRMRLALTAGPDERARAHQGQGQSAIGRSAVRYADVSPW